MVSASKALCEKVAASTNASGVGAATGEAWLEVTCACACCWRHAEEDDTWGRSPEAGGSICRPMWPVHEQDKVRSRPPGLQRLGTAPLAGGQRGRGGLAQTRTTAGFVMASACINHQRAT